MGSQRLQPRARLAFGLLMAFGWACVVSPAAALPAERSALSRFVNAVQHDQAMRGGQRCTAAGKHSLDKLARLLSNVAIEASKDSLKANPATGYRYAGHGQWGVFAGFYRDVKTEFMRGALCGNAAHPAPAIADLSTICEVGFMAGHTALLWLETMPGSKVISFDLGDMPWAESQGKALKAAYGGRFEILFGPSSATVPKYHAEHPDAVCGAVLIDGGKTKELRMKDLGNFRDMSRVGARLLFDEVTTMECVNATITEAECGDGWGGATKAYWQATHDGDIKILDCAWTSGMEAKDGICLAEYAV